MSNDTKDFLYAAIDDQRDIIRATDSKADILLVVLALPFAGIEVFAKSACEVANISCAGVSGWLLLVVGVVLWCLAFLSAICVVAPRTDPSRHLRLGDVRAKGVFYTAKHFGWIPFCSSHCKTDRITVSSHIAALPSDQPGVIAELGFEHLKLGYIAAVKLGWLRAACWFTGSVIVVAAMLAVVTLLQRISGGGA